MVVLAKLVAVLGTLSHVVVVLVAARVFWSSGLGRAPSASFPELWRRGATMVALDAAAALAHVASGCVGRDLLGWASWLLSCASGVLAALLALGLWRRRGSIAMIGAALVAASPPEEVDR